jgi:signal transduction histidine kinase
MLPAGNASAWWSGRLADLEARQDALRRELADLPPAPVPQGPEQAGHHSQFAARAEDLRWVQVDLGREWILDGVAVVPAVLAGTAPHGFPRRFRVDASNDPDFAAATTLMDHTGADAAESSLPWFAAVRGVPARYVRVTATRLAPQPRLPHRFIFCLGELLVFSEGRNVALHGEVQAGTAVETLPMWSPRHLVDGWHALGLPVRPETEGSNGWHGEVSPDPETAQWVQVAWPEPVPLSEIRLVPAHPGDYPDRFGFGFPRRFRVDTDAGTVFDATERDFPPPGDRPVALPAAGLRTRTIRVTATRLWERSGDFVFALGELQAFEGSVNRAPEASVTSSGDTRTGSWQPEFLVDGRISSGRLVPEREWLRGLSRRREAEQERDRLEEERAAEARKAQRRGLGLLGALVAALLLGSIGLLARARRARRRDLEALRRRISRDLHDEIGSHLGSIRLLSELALRDGTGAESLEEIHRLAREAAESMRGIVWLVREGGAPRLARLAEALRHGAETLWRGLEWRLETAPGSPDEATAPLAFHREVLLMFREMAHNITRHAGARAVRVVVDWNGGRFRLEVEDDGRGFRPGETAGGHGLENLRHRAEELGGVLRIESAPGRGTRLIVEAPLPGERRSLAFLRRVRYLWSCLPGPGRRSDRSGP